MVPFDYEVESGRILSVYRDEAFTGLQEPSVLISADASLVTGLSNEDVAGKAIDGNAVASLVNAADLVIAHNAAFDRMMVERHWPCFANKHWACSLTSVNWLQEGFSAGKLDYLGMQFGWFYEAHDALADCEACVALLAQELPKSGQRVMQAVREAAMQDDFLVRAVDSPFEQKNKLKAHGYRWRPKDQTHGGVWWTITAQPDAELNWLRTEIYGGHADIPVHRLTARERYSSRIWGELA
jgi:DNA polymerase-3 subunit epsilon